MQNHREGVVRACRCRCPSWVPLLFVMGCLNLLVTMAHAQFTLGTGRVVSVTPLDGGCISQDLPPSGTENWNIEQVFLYRVRLENVTECSGDTIHVHLFNPFRSEDDPDDCYHPQCLEATRVGDGAYEFTVQFPAPPRQGKRYFIRYCTSADCSAGGLLARRSDGGNAPSELRLSRFSQDCVWLAENKCEEPPVRCRDLDLGCLPSNDDVPDCSQLAALNIETDCPAGFVLLRCENGTIEPDPNREPCGYRRQNTYIIKDLCTFQVWELQCWVFWQVDNEPPVIDPPDGGDRGCNNPITCDEVLAQTTVTDNCPHEPPTVDCQSEDSRDGCIVTRTFTITATDKCGNRSTATVVYTWNEDTEPPVIDMPSGGDLGCNPEHIPDCNDVQVTDNCPHEPPTVDCQIEDRQDGCIWTRIITVTATDKCGNRSWRQEVYTWNEDTEPPVIDMPSGGDLGCNPEHIPDCNDVQVTDNCPHEPPTVDCQIEDRQDGCIWTRIITVTATDKCGNRSWRQEVYTWNEDREPPVIDMPSGGDLGCNPEHIPDCNDVQVTDNCPHEPPTVDCQIEDRQDGCIWTRIITVTATDKCGNRSWRQEVYTWNEDREPPVIDMPSGGDLGCNPEHIPGCDDVIVTDNCPHEPPTVDCQIEDRQDGCIWTRIITVTATDKCGNRSWRQEVYTWNEDRSRR
jgi:hypothetical protein